MSRIVAIALLCSFSAAAAPVSAQGGPPAAEPAQRLTLAQAHSMALQSHPGIAAADYRARASNEVFKQARAGLLPQVNAYFSAVDAGSDNTRVLAGGLNNPSVFDRKAVGAGLSQLITDFGHTSNLAASAKLQASAAGENATATREQVLFEVDRSFFAVLQAQAVQGVARQTLDTRQLLLDRVSILASNALKSDLDVSFARVALADAQLLSQKAQNDTDSALASLSAVLGLRGLSRFDLVDVERQPEAAVNDAGPLIDAALRNRPELAGLRDERDAAERLARSQRDARFPTISAVVVGGNSPSHDDRLASNYSAGGLQISVPLFAGGLYVARQDEAQLRAKAAAEALRAAEDSVARDVRIAWLAVTSARQRLMTTGQLQDYAQRAYELADARYRAGSSSIVELSQAQLELTSAQIGNAAARYDLLIQQAALQYQIGSAPPDASRRDATLP